MKQKIYWYNGWMIEKYHFEGSKPFWKAKPTRWFRSKLIDLENEYHLRELKFCPPQKNEMPCGCKDCTYTDSELKILNLKQEEKRKLVLPHNNRACEKPTMKACKKYIDNFYKNEIEKIYN